MQYQNHELNGDRDPGAAESVGPVADSQKEPNAARNIQIMIIVGLVAAIAVAIFGSY